MSIAILKPMSYSNIQHQENAADLKILELLDTRDSLMVDESQSFVTLVMPSFVDKSSALCINHKRHDKRRARDINSIDWLPIAS